MCQLINCLPGQPSAGFSYYNGINQDKEPMDFTTRLIIHNFETLRFYDFLAWHFDFIMLMEEQGVPIEEIVYAEDLALDLLLNY